ncbi:NBR1-Ig-like domain-containing protein [Actinoalloteichus spitiensis]|uniref:NBR1-Ig-like domain-containing protein n=1 Tax=Actinoalloteichus spitiensis TaxID=252394 RepID=UPI000370DAA0|nr:NBR1-Ig-like domain-containing protein [Actinoalloteichus spitiensis]
MAKRGRKPRTPDPNAGPVAEFAARLWELKQRAGDPSFETMSTRLGAVACKSSLSAAARGRELPSWETTWEFVRCLAVGVLERDAEEVLVEWRAHWERARARVDGLGEGGGGTAPVLEAGAGALRVPDPRAVGRAGPARTTLAPEAPPTRWWPRWAPRRTTWALRAGALLGIEITTTTFPGAGVGGPCLETTVANPLSTTRRLVPGDDSELRRDVNYPDGTTVRRGEEFVKIWELANTGSVFWRHRYLQRLGPDDPQACHAPRRVPIPPTAPGETALVSVPMRAPQSLGHSLTEWKMTDADGNFFLPDGLPVHVYVIVVP